MFSILRRSFRYLGKYKIGYLLAIFMMSTTVALGDVIISMIVKDIMTAISIDEYTNIVYKIGSKIIIGFILNVLWIAYTGLYNINAKIAAANIQKEVFSKALRLPITYYETHSYSDILTKLTVSTNRAGDIFGSKFRRVVAPFLSVITYLVPMMIFNYKLTTLLFIANAVLLLFTTLFSKPMRKLNKKLLKIMSKETKSFTNSINGFKTIKMYFIENTIMEKYKGILKNWFNTVSKLRLISSILSGLNSGFDLLCTLLFLGIGIMFLQNGQITIGELTAIYVLYGAFSASFLQMGINIPELAGALVYMQDIFDFLELPEELMGEKKERTFENDYVIEFKKVCFSYDSKKVLDNFSAKFESNKISVLTGKSGCGKSTLLKLIQGYYEIESGQILINGVDIREMGLVNARELIAYVPQQPYLFNRSIGENICIGKDDATQEQIIEASIKANAHDFIDLKPDKYETFIEEDGKSLSGGERQRIAIARAVLKDAPIVLLDEATAALDNNSERLFQQAIKGLMQDKTVIMVAHKPETIAFADVEFRM